jgi:hypothetical protein
MFRRKPGSVVSETVDQEAIVVNLLNGKYHRMEGLACQLWDNLIKPTSLESLEQQCRLHATPISTEAIITFLFALHEESLIESDDEAFFSQANPVCNDPALCVESYDDMADLLLLDPIHDVDEAGWPNQNV